MPDIGSIFNPKSIAIIGASSSPDSLGSKNFLHPLLHFGYPGKLYPVNPNCNEVLGLKAYASLRDISEPVDYVICAVAASRTPQLMHDCVETGAKLVALYCAGFSDTGDEEGTRLEEELLEIARGGGVRLLGPNCLGIHNPESRVIFEIESATKSGNVGFFSQSGGNNRELLAIGATRGIYFSKAVSYGNAIDLNESDFLEYFSGDDETDIIAGYIEGIKEPQRFARVLGQAAKTKPVIVLKGGQTEAGRGAAASHTGSLAGSKEVWDALCRQKGAIQVANLDEMADAILAFSYLKPPQGRRVGIIGVGGGMSVQAADDFENAGLIVPPFCEEVRKELREFNPKEGTGIRNPLDASQHVYQDLNLFTRALEVVSGCENIDTMLVIMAARHAVVRNYSQVWMQQVEAVIEASKRLDKPMAVILLSPNSAEAARLTIEVQKRFSEAGVASFSSSERAAKAIDRLISYHERHRQTA